MSQTTAANYWTEVESLAQREWSAQIAITQVGQNNRATPSREGGYPSPRLLLSGKRR